MAAANDVRRDETLLLVMADGDFGWRFRVTSPDGSVSIVTGPALPPIGVGSARLFTGTNGDLSAELRLSTFDGTLLEQITDIRYWTYDMINNGQQWPYIILQIDLTGDGTVDDLLFFEPAFQTPATGNPTLPDQGPPILNTWQRWNALPGGWWSLNSIGGATPGNGVKPISTYLAAAPTARIVGSPGGFGGIRVLHGFASPGDVFDGFVDAFSISATPMEAPNTYNFDPFVAPTPPIPPTPPTPGTRAGGFVTLQQPLFVSEGSCGAQRVRRPFRPFGV